MFERMLDRRNEPTVEAFISYCGSRGGLLADLDTFLTNEMMLERTLRFPYGNRYGWGFKYSVKKRHICDVFAEKDAFSVMVRLDDSLCGQIHDAVSPYTQGFLDTKYPCGDGGYIHYRVLTSDHLKDIEMLLRYKIRRK